MLGERIKMVRLSREMTQEELGKIIGVGKSTINKYELNKIAIPSAKIEALAKALNVPPGYLMGWESVPENVKQAAEQVAFRIEMGDFTAEEMYLVRAYRNASNFERAFLDAAVYLVSRESAPQPQEEANPDGLLAAASLTRQYLQAQSQRETVDK